MGSDANFDAYRRYTALTESGAVDIIDGGQQGGRDDYIIVDFDRFRSLDAGESARLIDVFAQAAQGRYDSDVHAEMTLDVAAAREGVGLLGDNGGGYNHWDQNIVLIDSQTLSFDRAKANVLGAALPPSSEHDEMLYDQFAREHEAAHMLLGLNEAGSDYMASMRLLERHPGDETKAFLQTMADLRLMAPYRASADTAGMVVSEYGYGCAEAIQAALQTPVSARGDIEQQYGNAQIYEAMNNRSQTIAAEGFARPIRPEMAVRHALLNENPTLADDDYQRGGLATSAQALLDKGQFQDGTVPHKILEDLVEGAGRMDAQLGGVTAHHQPSVKMDMNFSL